MTNPQATSQSAKPSSLSGMRVLDFSTAVAGPFCSRLMADLGADVIKIESHEGDNLRTRPPLRSGLSSYFGQLNCGKRSICLDLKNKDAIATVRELIKTADVLVENFRPGVMDKLGLGYTDVAKLNPKLVYCSMSGFGQTGPDSHLPAYAPMIHAASGYEMAHFHYQDNADRPANSATFMADIFAGVYGFSAIQAALLYRERAGIGQQIDVSMLDGMLNLLVYEFQEAQFPSAERRSVFSPLRASDGFVIVVPLNRRNFTSLFLTIGHPELTDDPRFETSVSREKHWGELNAYVEEWTRQRTAVECERIMMEAGVPCSRYLTVAEAMKKPQLSARGSFSTAVDAAGEFLVPNPPFQFSAMRAEARTRVPALGEHTAEVLREIFPDDQDLTARLVKSPAPREGS